ncbi:hypothetical protein J2X77_001197 [Sphingobacterium sp. 2149]|uniref:hypothetical protein n=1 Tax=Sphingobacterium sp. UBA3549 TaxID=1947496 RepID=UPI001B45DC8A|nr:hypothetical protein [Sphingobacterium sp. UBA3549]MDR6734346.1 hypothetical protein [Sphingobacterium sp. 2149]
MPLGDCNIGFILLAAFFCILLTLLDIDKGYPNRYDFIKSRQGATGNMKQLIVDDELV